MISVSWKQWEGQVVDLYFPVIDAFDRYIDGVETAVVENPQAVRLPTIRLLARPKDALKAVTAMSDWVFGPAVPVVPPNGALDSTTDHPGGTDPAQPVTAVA